MTSAFRVYTITYNVGDTPPPDDFTRLLKLDSKELPQIYAIGLQELKHSPGSLITDSIYDDPWTLKFTDALGKRNYVRIKSVRLLGMHLAVFVHRPCLNYVCNVESESTATGFGGLWGNKGGISVRLDISGVNICFVNCHLPAHQNNVAARIQDYDMILESQSFDHLETQRILDHDYVFWIGDLNFRLDGLPKAEIESRAEAGKSEDFQFLLTRDQLMKAMKDELLLIDFEEGEINFPPTYRFDKGTDVYDTSPKQRKPAYCDRILYMVHEDSFHEVKLDVQQLTYCSLQEYKLSDHKPVVAEFLIQVLSYPQELPVMFEPMGTWHTGKDQKVYYTVTTAEYQVDSKDWIGLYSHDYKHMHDYKTYVWASVKADDLGDGSSMFDVDFDKYYVKDLDGMFCLCYFSHKKNCVTGYSDTFRISSKDESSDESSEPGDLTDSSDSDTPLSRPKTAKKKHRMKNRVRPL